jgi:hypothetical protein
MEIVTTERARSAWSRIADWLEALRGGASP